MAEEKFDFKKFEKVSNKSRYERRIAELSKSNKETTNIEEVVEASLKNVKDKENSFIIYGDPQCGKTEMMIALTAKLLDEGHKIIILLVTDNLSLLRQNLERFRNSGIDPSPKNFDEILDNNITLGESNWVIFCKKMHLILKN
jgi:DNA replication protein DnaC